MSDTMILYYSKHHGNTEKLARAAAEAVGADLLALPAEKLPDLSNYRTVGFASGIYFSKFHASVLNALHTWASKASGKRAFLLYTSGSGTQSGAAKPEAELRAAGVRMLGIYSCKGFDTYGPFKLVGGIAKGHPTTEELSAGAEAVRQFLKAE